MAQSPMFKHAIESFEHGLEHYLDGSERSRKFALLHIDQAIELVLKEKIVQLGKSIYKTDGTTLNLHEAFKSLKDLSIAEQPRLEELHDLRNTVQHKGLTPDSTSTQFYIEIAYSFFKRFLQDELSTPIDDILPKKYRALMEGVVSTPELLREASEVNSALNEALVSDNIYDKIIKGYTALSLASNYLGSASPGGVKFRGTLRQAARDHGFPKEKLEPYLVEVLALRNQVMHSDYKPTETDAEEYLKAVNKILEMVGFLTKGNNKT